MKISKKSILLVLLSTLPTFCYADGQDGLGTFIFGLFLFTFLFFVALFVLVYVVVSSLYNQLKFKLSLWIAVLIFFLVLLIFNFDFLDLIGDVTLVFF